jgi:hypothetical protein
MLLLLLLLVLMGPSRPLVDAGTAGTAHLCSCDDQASIKGMPAVVVLQKQQRLLPYVGQCCCWWSVLLPCICD